MPPPLPAALHRWPTDLALLRTHGCRGLPTEEPLQIRAASLTARIAVSIAATWTFTVFPAAAFMEHPRFRSPRWDPSEPDEGPGAGALLLAPRSARLLSDAEVAGLLNFPAEDGLSERADHSNPALLGRLEDLARAAIAIRTTVRDVVNIDPSSRQAARLVPMGDEVRTAFCRILFHDVLFARPPPPVLADMGEARAYRGAEAHRVLARATPPSTVHMAFHAVGETTSAQLAAALAAGGARDILPGDLPSLPRDQTRAEQAADAELRPSCSTFAHVNRWLRCIDERTMLLEDRFFLLAPVFADVANENGQTYVSLRDLNRRVRFA